jgi:hypothetical protein
MGTLFRLVPGVRFPRRAPPQSAASFKSPARRRARANNRRAVALPLGADAPNVKAGLEHLQDGVDLHHGHLILTPAFLFSANLPASSAGKA